MNTSTHYDVAIIGAGMAGLAAGIRLAHFGKKVCIFERHNVTGALNSFYTSDGRKYDVGLHAMTNFVRAGVKGTPLTKLLRQLRIERDEFALCEQKRSRVAFGPRGEVSLTFTNDFAVFESEVARQFPAQIDGFRRLVGVIRSYDDVSLGAQPESARAVIRREDRRRRVRHLLEAHAVGVRLVPRALVVGRDPRRVLAGRGIAAERDHGALLAAHPDDVARAQHRRRALDL